MLHGIGGRNPLLLLGGGGALVVVVVALARRSSNNSSGSTSATVPAAGYDSSLADYENYFQDQLNNLQQQIVDRTPTPTSGGTTSGTPRPVVHGGQPPARVGGPVRAHAPAPRPASRTQAVVRVRQGDTLSRIAARYGETWQQVWAYNLSGVRPDTSVLKRRGANDLVRGEEIYIPKK